jgi:hypothetical protein
VLECESLSQERRILQMMGFGRMVEEAPLTLNFRTSQQKIIFPKNNHSISLRFFRELRGMGHFSAEEK